MSNKQVTKKRHRDDDESDMIEDEPVRKQRKTSNKQNRCDKDLQLLCFGYFRQYFKNENINYNPYDISSVTYKYLFIDWKFEFDDDFNNERNQFILNDSKTFACDENHETWAYCGIEMTPNTGFYKIKIKIGENIHNSSDFLVHNCIGITSDIDNLKTVNSWMHSKYYIGWSPCGYEGQGSCVDFTHYGLMHGSDNFFKKDLKYQSMNQYNEYGLPKLNGNDIIVMKYDSNKGELYFSKENDNTCNSKINVPQNKTMYWFVGHDFGKCNMIVNIL